MDRNVGRENWPTITAFYYVRKKQNGRAFIVYLFSGQNPSKGLKKCCVCSNTKRHVCVAICNFLFAMTRR